MMFQSVDPHTGQGWGIHNVLHVREENYSHQHIDCVI